jgi:hypothetical protein
MGTLPTIDKVNIGISPGISGGWNGCIDEVRIDNVGRYTSNFTPASAEYTGTALLGPNSSRPYGVPLNQSSPTTVNKQTIGDTKSATVAAIGSVRDLEDGGLYRVSGTVKEKSLPDNHPLRRRVRLVIETSGRIIREVWSDAVTGNYTFDGIRGDYKYTVISYDHLHNYRAIIADNVIADIMT